jgi:RNA polymerase sigma-70 factor (ECF subfamily)
MATGESDRFLAEAVVRGDQGAAETLFDRVFDPLYRQVCARLGGDHDEAQDIVSESLLAGLRGLADFRGEARLETWFTAIALRKVADRKRRRAVLLVSSPDGELERLLAGSRGERASPLQSAADAELQLLVREAVEALPDRHRCILRWKYFDDSSLGDVAVRLNVSPKAVERRLARARTALAAALRQRRIAP